MSPNYEPASEPLHSSVTQLYLNSAQFCKAVFHEPALHHQAGIGTGSRTQSWTSSTRTSRSSSPSFRARRSAPTPQSLHPESLTQILSSKTKDPQSLKPNPKTGAAAHADGRRPQGGCARARRTGYDPTHLKSESSNSKPETRNPKPET